MMKLPNDETPQNHLNGDGYLSDDYEQLEMMPAPIRDGDFSEYMWMENEEEFNSQVLRELEEQELMEECIHAMLNDDTTPSEDAESPSAGNNSNNSRTSNDNSNAVNGLSESVNILSLSSNGVRNNSSDNSQNSQDSSRYTAQSRLDRFRPNAPEPSRNHSNSLQSNLNPDAKEFVPLPRSTVNPDHLVPS